MIHNQPRALYLISFAQMWDCFSYYGMRAILILYMVKKINMSDNEAYSIYAVYCGLIYMTSIVGGYLADKKLGLKNSIKIGALTMMLGHICMSLTYSEFLFYHGLALIGLGSGLFGCNNKTLLGKFYDQNDRRREEGYTFMYISINVGAFASTILCSYAGENYGWHYGFGLAAIGMLIGVTALYKYDYILKDHGNADNFPLMHYIKWISSILLGSFIVSIFIFYSKYTIYVMSIIIVGLFMQSFVILKGCNVIEKKNIINILILVIFFSIFYAFQEQIGSTIILFTERNVDTMIFGLIIPVSSVSMTNPLTIIVFGPLIAIFVSRIKINIYYKISLAFLLNFIAYIVLYLSCKVNSSLVSVSYVLLNSSIIAIAELFIGPQVYSLCSALAPDRFQARLMALVSLGGAFATILSSFLSKFNDANISDKNLYSNYFFIISSLSIMFMIIAILFGRYKRL